MITDGQDRKKLVNWAELAQTIKHWATELGFQATGISATDLAEDEHHLLNWLDAGRHGEMEYMRRHGVKRSRPAALLPGTVRVISVRMDYWPEPSLEPFALLDDPSRGFVSRYALGRDYHKILRRRLQRLADRIAEQVGPFGYRAFVDSAPVLEKALARNAGLGWIGKHTNLLSRDAGSYFFLGELYTDLPLPVDEPLPSHCGQCDACIRACPTDALVAPYELDARRCVSYLTIEHHGPIPELLRPLIGNRIYGCDDCQLVCPWNRFAAPTQEPDYTPRAPLDGLSLTDGLGWSREEFLRRTEGSAIRRIGHERWLRNVAVALGNGASDVRTRAALRARLCHPSELVREHVVWALARLSQGAGTTGF